MYKSHKIEYKDIKSFILECAKRDIFSAIHWRENRGFIWFRINENYVIHKGEIHLFYSDNLNLLESAWNAIGLIRHALKGVKNETTEK